MICASVETFHDHLCKGSPWVFTFCAEPAKAIGPPSKAIPLKCIRNLKVIKSDTPIKVNFWWLKRTVLGGG